MGVSLDSWGTVLVGESEVWGDSIHGRVKSLGTQKEGTSQVSWAAGYQDELDLGIQYRWARARCGETA